MSHYQRFPLGSFGIREIIVGTVTQFSSTEELREVGCLFVVQREWLSVLMVHLQHCFLFFFCWGWGFLQVHHRAGISAACHTGGHRKRGEEHCVAHEESRVHEDLVAAKTQLKCKKKTNISQLVFSILVVALFIRISSETQVFYCFAFFLDRLTVHIMHDVFAFLVYLNKEV